jgi:predicted nucleotidyltransferase
MDKNDAIKIGKTYVEKARQHNIPVLEAWLFGSYVKGTHDKNSDIDIALILPDNEFSFATEVLLMTLRNGNETMIEPHLYGKNDFQEDTPMTVQIKKYGLQMA